MFSCNRAWRLVMRCEWNVVCPRYRRAVSPSWCNRDVLYEVEHSMRVSPALSDIASHFGNFSAEDMARVRLESGERTTRENAQQLAKLLGVRCQVTPHPVDFRTGASTPLTEYSLAHSLLRWQTALHEWLDVLAYGLTR